MRLSAPAPMIARPCCAVCFVAGAADRDVRGGDDREHEPRLERGQAAPDLEVEGEVDEERRLDAGQEQLRHQARAEAAVREQR